MYPVQFNYSIKFVFGSEGVDSDDAEDHGGRTRYGISQAAYPKLNIASLTKDQALELYYQDYWIVSGCNYYTVELGAVVLDTAVNCGVPRTLKWLQRACTQLGYPLKDDGVLGQKTRMAIGLADNYRLAILLVSQRLRHYIKIVDMEEDQGEFLHGWTLRVANLLEYINKIT